MSLTVLTAKAEIEALIDSHMRILFGLTRDTITGSQRWVAQLVLRLSRPFNQTLSDLYLVHSMCAVSRKLVCAYMALNDGHKKRTISIHNSSSNITIPYHQRNSSANKIKHTTHKSSPNQGAAMEQCKKAQHTAP
jgi:hypothetical protein